MEPSTRNFGAEAPGTPAGGCDRCRQGSGCKRSLTGTPGWPSGSPSSWFSMCSCSFRATMADCQISSYVLRVSGAPTTHSRDNAVERELKSRLPAPSGRNEPPGRPAQCSAAVSRVRHAPPAPCRAVGPWPRAWPARNASCGSLASAWPGACRCSAQQSRNECVTRRATRLASCSVSASRGLRGWGAPAPPGRFQTGFGWAMGALWRPAEAWRASRVPRSRRRARG